MAIKYSEEFKEQAMALAAETGVTVAASRLGMSSKTLHGWRQAKRIHEGLKLPQGDAQMQVKVLQRENEELRQANQILKKAMGFFVKG